MVKPIDCDALHEFLKKVQKEKQREQAFRAAIKIIEDAERREAQSKEKEFLESKLPKESWV